MSKPTKRLTITAVFDDETNAVTAFFNELPGLVVQGKSEDDVENKLRSLLQSYIKRLQNADFEIKTQTLS